MIALELGGLGLLLGCCFGVLNCSRVDSLFGNVVGC